MYDDDIRHSMSLKINLNSSYKKNKKLEFE